MYTLLHIISIVVAVAIAVAIGWWLRDRRLSQLGLTRERIRKAIDEFKQIEQGLGQGIDAHTRTMDRIQEQRANIDSESVPQELFDEVVAANDQLIVQLNDAERRLRDLRQAMESGEAPESMAGAATPEPAMPVKHTMVTQHQEDELPTTRREQNSLTPVSLPSLSEEMSFEASENDNPELRASPADQAVAQGDELRAHHRRAMLKELALAPYVEGSFPAPDQFFVAKGHDISEGGISFFLPAPPAHEAYVVVLGKSPRCAYVKAVVVRVAKKHMYLVGCQFKCRLTPPPIERKPVKSEKSARAVMVSGPRS